MSRMNPPHVEHAVRLVEHEDLDVREVHGLLLRVIEQAAGCGHEDVHALAQAVGLRLETHAAEHDHGLEREMTPVVADVLLHLGRKLAGGGEDQAG